MKILQTKLNAYVKAKNLKYPTLKVDGMLGEKTLGVIEIYLVIICYQSQTKYKLNTS